MANISFDTEDRPVVLRLVRDMLNALLNDESASLSVPTPTPVVPGQSDGTSTSFVSDADAGAGEQVTADQKGVAFNGDFCSKSEKPFYDKGPRQGQWKKRRGVEDAEYDKWYAAELSVLSSSMAENVGGTLINTAAAFTQETPDDSTPAGPSIDTFGDLMGWVAVKQDAGLLDENDLMVGYDQAAKNLHIQKIEIQELFEDSDDARRKIRAVYDALSQKAGA